MAAAAGDHAYGAVSVRIAYFARAEVVGRVPASVFIPRPRVESVLVRLERRPEPAVDPAAGLLRAAGRGGAGRVRPAAQDAAALAGRRRSTRRPSTRAGVRPDARAEELDVAAWGRLAARDDRASDRVRRLGPGQADPVAAGDRRAPRRLPRARRRDGHARPGRRARARPRRVRARRRRPSRGRGPTGCRARRQPGHAGPGRGRAAGPPCTWSSASRSAAGWAAARPTPRPSCAGPAVPTSTVAARLGADVPFCVVGGRARVEGVGERVDAARLRGPRLTCSLMPPFGVDTAAVYRAWDDGPAGSDGRRQCADGGGPAGRAAAGRAGATPSGSDRARAGAGRERLDLVRRGRRARRRAVDAPPRLHVGAETARLVRARTVPAGWEGD